MCNIPDNVLKQLQEDVSAIKVALLGNEYNPAGGLLCRTTELELELEKLKNRYDKMVWTAAGAAAAVSVLISVIVFILQTIF